LGTKGIKELVASLRGVKKREPALTFSVRSKPKEKKRINGRSEDIKKKKKLVPPGDCLSKKRVSERRRGGRLSEKGLAICAPQLLLRPLVQATKSKEGGHFEDLA